MPESLPINPVSSPVVGSIRPPGSKSLSNRALIVAALAEGHTQLTGILDSDDTRVMVNSLARLGINVQHDPALCTADVEGCGGKPPAEAAELWLENSGTSIRFLTALCSLGHGTFRLDGNERMRERPIAPLVAALKQLGAEVACEAANDCPPVVVKSQGLAGGRASVTGNISSQYLSGLLMAAPGADSGVEIHVESTLVSKPYVDMTLAVMSHFGVVIDEAVEGRYRIEPQTYRGTTFPIEPDASAASYFFAAAAITGGRVTVLGLTEDSLQGDVRFVDALRQMGCQVTANDKGITVVGGELNGIDIDMNAISDTAQTLAAVAVFADGPTRIRNVPHIRHKETDRIEAVATELRRLGQRVDVFDDGLEIHPQPLKSATIETYDDHRMAMSFALVGLKHAGVRIADPDCTAKTYPAYFDDLQALCGGNQ